MRSLSFLSLVCWLARIFLLFFLLEKEQREQNVCRFPVGHKKKEEKEKSQNIPARARYFCPFDKRSRGERSFLFSPSGCDVLRLSTEKEEKTRAIKTALTRLARHSRLQTKQKTGPIESLRFRFRKMKAKRALLIVPLKRRRRGKTDGHNRVVSSQTRSAKSYGR